MAGEEKRQACYSLGSVLLKGTIARDVGTTGALPEGSVSFSCSWGHAGSWVSGRPEYEGNEP